MLDKILDQPLNSWLTEADEATHIVLSSRIRLARNFKGIIFTNRNEEKALAQVDEMMRSVLTDLTKADKREYSDISLDKLSETEREILVEKHLISPQLAQSGKYRSIVVADDASAAIMVNEEDHIRIQTMEAGLNLQEAYSHAELIDDAVEGRYDYAFSERFGYLTACPTNVGTGMRASVMLHLPALVMTQKINRLIRGIIQLGYSVRGLYGEGSQALGNIFQVSNQLTMGMSEETTIEELTKVVKQLVQEEEQCCMQLARDREEEIEDRVWRAYGILSHARRVNGEEALALISDVQLGMDMGIIPKGKKNLFNELIVITRPNFLAKYAGKEDMTPVERDAYRATILRDRLAAKK